MSFLSNEVKFKIQVFEEVIYVKVKNFPDNKVNVYHTFHLKSVKGLEVVLRSIDAEIHIYDIKRASEAKGFRFSNILYMLKKKPPLLMFKVQQAPNLLQLSKNTVYPIFTRCNTCYTEKFLLENHSNAARLLIILLILGRITI